MILPDIKPQIAIPITIRLMIVRSRGDIYMLILLCGWLRLTPAAVCEAGEAVFEYYAFASVPLA